MAFPVFIYGDHARPINFMRYIAMKSAGDGPPATSADWRDLLLIAIMKAQPEISIQAKSAYKRLHAEPV